MSQTMNQAAALNSSFKSDYRAYPYDGWLIACVVLLVGIGLVMATSASVSKAAPMGSENGNMLHFFWRQFVALSLGVVLGIMALKTPLQVLKKLRYVFLLLTMLLLVLVITPLGKEVNGASRWLDLGVYDLQASEIAKLLIVIYLAGYMEQHLVQVRTAFSGLYNPIIVLTIICTLLLLEPDFGTSVLLFGTMLGLLFMAGIPMLRIIVWGGVAVAFLAWAATSASYRMARLKGFINPWEDAQGTGYQLVNSLIAIGRGEWTGVGLGNSVQKLFYLPEAHTDFIFAVLAEELGVIGCMAVIALFLFFIWRVFKIGAEAEKGGRYFPAYLAYGFGLLIGMQAFFNMGVNLGVLPTKGMTLPFISYGGNSLIMVCVAAAIILRVDYETRSTEEEVDES